MNGMWVVEPTKISHFCTIFPSLVSICKFFFKFLPRFVTILNENGPYFIQVIGESEKEMLEGWGTIPPEFRAYIDFYCFMISKSLTTIIL